MVETPGAQFLRLGWNSEIRVDLARCKQFERLFRRVGDPVNIAERVEADPRRQRAEKDLGARPERLSADTLAPEIHDPADRAAREQLEAADMHAGQNRDWRATVDRSDELRGKIQCKVSLAARDNLRGIGIRGSARPSTRSNSSAAY